MHCISLKKWFCFFHPHFNFFKMASESSKNLDIFFLWFKLVKVDQNRFKMLTWGFLRSLNLNSLTKFQNLKRKFKMAAISLLKLTDLAGNASSEVFGIAEIKFSNRIPKKTSRPPPPFKIDRFLKKLQFLIFH